MELWKLTMPFPLSALWTIECTAEGVLSEAKETSKFWSCFRFCAVGDTKGQADTLIIHSYKHKGNVLETSESKRVQF